MIRCVPLIALSFLFSLLAFDVSAQKKDSLNMGELKGILKDTVHNYVLQSATVSIYKANDSRLLAYGLSNKMGQFVIKGLPLGTPLRFVASHIRYKSYQKDFYIPIDKPTVDLKTLNMGTKADSTLEEVIISAKPPVTMNGDTLEFNADAFQLDTNATLEDLMRKLTGVTIWSDGLITVNGVKVNNLFVDGKKFFGGDATIALQNLPKNIVEKVQVYKGEQFHEDKEPDLNVNVVLKKDKKSGLFGKIGGGYGTDKRYNFDGMLSGYTPKTQLSIIGAHNNVNKTAASVSTLMQYSSFKGEAVDHEYNSDFRQPGLNISTSAGSHFAHEFKKDNTLTADYFLSKSKNTILRNELTIDNLTNNNQLIRNNSATTRRNDFDQKIDGNYEVSLPHQRISARYSMSYNTSKGTDQMFSTTENTETGSTATGLIGEQYNRKLNRISASVNFDNRSYALKNKTKSFNYELAYKFDQQDGDNSRQSKTDIVSNDALSDQFFNRSYHTNFRNDKHELSLRVPNLNGITKVLNKFLTMNFKNDLVLYHSKENAAVYDILRGGEYDPNLYLTNNSTYKTVLERPGLSLNKTFRDGLVNRYNKSLDFQFVIQGEMFYQKNASDKSFQNINRSYTNFIPEVSITYDNQQVGRYQSTYKLRYAKSVVYPEIYQLAPLTDSANVYFLRFGNPGLTPSKKHEFKLSVDHLINKSRNGGNGNFTIIGGSNSDLIADSIIYDQFGRRILYNVNTSGNKYIGYQGFMSKVYQFKENQLQIYLNSEFEYSHYPSFINGLPTLLKMSNSSQSVHFGYSYKSWLKVSSWQTIRGNSTRQTNSSEIDFTYYSTAASVSVKWPKKLIWGSNIALNRSVSSYSEPIDYTIWNVNVAYRFLKGDNAELKFAALDLLHQNTAVINTGSSNRITRGTVNVLQQYFMFSMAYYPRIFGNTGSKK
jgi:hypothetical protein